MARHIMADGRITTFLAPRTSDVWIAEMQRRVGGYVESRRLTQRQWLLMDEDARTKTPMSPVNAFASRLAGFVVLGDVVVCVNSEMDTDDGEPEGDE